MRRETEKKKSYKMAACRIQQQYGIFITWIIRVDQAKRSNFFYNQHPAEKAMSNRDSGQIFLVLKYWHLFRQVLICSIRRLEIFTWGVSRSTVNIGRLLVFGIIWEIYSLILPGFVNNSNFAGAIFLSF